MKLRIVICSKFHSLTKQRLKTVAVQRRVAFFWWVTVGYCDSISQARIYARNKRFVMKSEKVDRVVEEA